MLNSPAPHLCPFIIFSFTFSLKRIISVNLFSPAAIFLDSWVLLLLCLSSTHDLWWMTFSYYSWSLFANSVNKTLQDTLFWSAGLNGSMISMRDKGTWGGKVLESHMVIYLSFSLFFFPLLFPLRLWWYFYQIMNYSWINMSIGHHWSIMLLTHQHIQIILYDSYCTSQGTIWEGILWMCQILLWAEGEWKYKYESRKVIPYTYKLSCPPLYTLKHHYAVFYMEKCWTLTRYRYNQIN